MLAPHGTARRTTSNPLVFSPGACTQLAPNSGHYRPPPRYLTPHESAIIVPIPHLYPPLHSLTMTILSTEPRGNGFFRTSDSTSVKSPSSYINGSSTTTAPRPGPSTLLSKFIEQFYELESYKSVDSFLLLCCASWSQPCLEMAKLSSSMATVFPCLHLSALPDTIHKSF